MKRLVFIATLLAVIVTAHAQQSVGPMDYRSLGQPNGPAQLDANGRLLGSQFKNPNIIDMTVAPYSASTDGADNATAIQTAINDAISTGKPLYIPAGAPGTCYKYTAPLTINGDLTMYGASVSENWNNGINVPLGTPPLNGSVLCPTSNGQNAITITGTSRHVDISNLGILFQTPFFGTGDAINYVPAVNIQGLSGSKWENIKVWGHDGNHYAYNLTNPIVNTIIAAFAYGGGGFKLNANVNNGGQYGNIVFIHPYTQVITGGTSDGYNLSSNVLAGLNLMTFIRPQAIIDQVAGVSPSSALPTTAQLIWNQDVNTKTIRVVHPDLETNIGAGMTMGAAGLANTYDWDALIGDAAFINAPNWGQNGILSGSRSFTFTDTTGTGTIPLVGMRSMTGMTVKATNAVNYTILASLIVGGPVASTNVTAPTQYALYSLGGIGATGAYSGSGGAFINGGSIVLNKNNNNLTEIGDGTTSSQVTIGGGANKVAVGSALMTGSVTPLTMTTGEIGMTKIAASGSAPGAAGLKLATVCGTNAGTAKVIAYAGTSTTPVTIMDNIGAGVTGC